MGIARGWRIKNDHFQILEMCKKKTLEFYRIFQKLKILFLIGGGLVDAWIGEKRKKICQKYAVN